MPVVYFSEPPLVMAVRPSMPCRLPYTPLSPVNFRVLYLQAQRQGVGKSSAPAVSAMTTCLLKGTSLILAGQHVTTVAESVSRQTLGAVRWGCAPCLVHLLLLLIALRSIVCGIGSRLVSACAIGVFSQFVRIFCGWWGTGPQLNPSILSTSLVCSVVVHNHAPIFCAVFDLEWGFWQGRGSLVLTLGISFTLDFYQNIT